MGRFKQYLGIKFPFTKNQDNGLFIDLNEKPEDKVASQIVHVLLTPKRQRIRKPMFGTDLIQYIFGGNTEEDWEMIKNEAIQSISKYVPNTTLTEIEIYRDEGVDHDIYLDLRYEVSNGMSTENNRMVVKL